LGIKAETKDEIAPDKNVDLPPSSSIDTELEAWQSAYAEFLTDLSVLDDYEGAAFSLRDLDSDGVPELIIVQSYEREQIRVISVYSYNCRVYEIGKCNSPNSYAGDFRLSDNPMFPGLFSFRWGGSIFRYGYLTVEEGQLVYRDLYNMDHYHYDPPQQINISDDMELIDESRSLFPGYGFTDNLLERYPINSDNIDRMILCTQ